MRVPAGRFCVCASRTAYLCGLVFLISGCAGKKVVTVPEVIEVIRYERVQIPDQLLKDCVKSPVPSELTYGQALSLWAEDRAKLDACGGQIEGIGVLNNVDTDGTE